MPHKFIFAKARLIGKVQINVRPEAHWVQSDADFVADLPHRLEREQRDRSAVGHCAIRTQKRQRRRVRQTVAEFADKRRVVNGQHLTVRRLNINHCFAVAEPGTIQQHRLQLSRGQIRKDFGAGRISERKEAVAVDAAETDKGRFQFLAAHTFDRIAPEAIHGADTIAHRYLFPRRFFSGGGGEFPSWGPSNEFGGNISLFPKRLCRVHCSLNDYSIPFAETYRL